MLFKLMIYLILSSYNVRIMGQRNIELNSVNINKFTSENYNSGYCENFLKKFADDSANFVRCVILKAKPVRICEACVEFYIAFQSSYQNILQEQDGTKKCRDIFFNVDRLEVIESMYQYSNDIWIRAQCDSCFEKINNSLTINLTHDVLIFMELYNATLDCIITTNISNNASVICIDCMDIYIKLNNVYNELEKKNEFNNVCMDIVDSMNFTRKLWSSELDCCRLRKHPEITFICLTFIVACFPIFFIV